MLHRRLLVSLASLVSLILLHAAGCGAPQQPMNAQTDAAAAAPSPPVAPAASGSSSETRATSETSSHHKRARTGPPKPLAHDGTKPKHGRPLNPKDNLGRTVFVRADDHCFVEIPKPEDPTARATEVVDCPPAADDAAWDHCTAQIVLDEDGTKCFCVTGAGNPRPMPNPTLCPASAKAK